MNVKKILLSLAILYYLVFLRIDEHYVLTISIVLCLYSTYDVISRFIKNEIRDTAEAIYRETSSNSERAIEVFKNKLLALNSTKAVVSSVSSINDRLSETVSSGAGFGTSDTSENVADLLFANSLEYESAVFNLKMFVLNSSFR